MAKYSDDSDSDYSSKHRRRRYRRSRSSSSNSDSSPRRRRSKQSRSKRRHKSRSPSRDRRSRRDRSHSRGASSSKSKSKRYDRTRRSTSIDRRSKNEKQLSEASTSSQTTAIDDDMLIESRITDSVLNDINSEGFAPKSFTSSRDKKAESIFIDLTADTIRIENPKFNSKVDNIFHISLSMDQDEKFEKWVKKLFTLRQKALADVMLSD